MNSSVKFTNELIEQEIRHFDGFADNCFRFCAWLEIVLYTCYLPYDKYLEAEPGVLAFKIFGIVDRVVLLAILIYQCYTNNSELWIRKILYVWVPANFMWYTLVE